MTKAVEQIAREVKALPAGELDEFLSWLAEFESGRTDSWDDEIARDSNRPGPLRDAAARARADIDAGNARPLDELLDNK